MSEPIAQLPSNHETPPPVMAAVQYFRQRTVQLQIPSTIHPEGVNLTVNRTIGTSQLPHCSPFLLLDHFAINNPTVGAGFPDHPHHGQETITYLFSGSIAHEDFTGSSGVIQAGDLQVMFAGKGIVHAEMPVVEESYGKGRNGKASKGEKSGLIEGIQLWVDIPKELKNGKPKYKDIKREKILVGRSEDGKASVKVIAGEAFGVKSKAKLSYAMEMCYYDYELTQPDIEIKQSIPDGFTAIIYVLQGSLQISDNVERINAKTLAILNNDGDHIKVRQSAKAGSTARFVIIAAPPLPNQEIHQEGPFVETSRDKVNEVVKNYQNAVRGFEKSKGWKSNIREGVSSKDVQNGKVVKPGENTNGLEDTLRSGKGFKGKQKKK